MREGWESYKLKDLLEIKYGKDHKKLKDGKYPLYGSGGIMRYVDEYLYNDESILIPRKGTLSNLFYLNTPFSTVDTMFWSKIDKEKVFPKFLYYLLKTYDLSLLDVGAAIPSLTTKILKEVSVRIPESQETQRKIASILSAYDDLIENNLKRIKLLEEQAQQTYEEWFVRFKFPEYEDVEIDEVSGLPFGWKKTTLDELVSLQQGFALNKKSNHHISKKKTGFPLLKIGDLFNGTETLFVKETIPKQFLVNRNEIIYSRTGQVGHAFMGRKGVIYNNCFRVSANNKIERLLLYYFLISPSIVETAKSLATGSAQPDLNHGAFKSIQINLPPVDIQKKFSVPMEKNLELIYNLLNQNQLLKEARDILLPRMMMGMIDPSTSSGQVVDGLGVYEGLGMVAEKDNKFNN